MSHFANCSGFSEIQVALLAKLRGSASVAACVANLILLTVACACQSKLKFGQEKKWLKVYLFALYGVSISYLSVLSLSVVYHLLPASSAGTWCTVFGFFDQILSVIQITLLFINTNPIMLFLWSEITRGHKQTVCCKKNWISRGSVSTAIVLAAIIVISSILPFITGTYGEVGGWCWIFSIGEDCEMLVVGLMEEIFLLIVYQILISLMCLLMILTAVILFLRACVCRLSVYRNLDAKHDYIYLFFKYFFQLIILLPSVFNFASVTFTDPIHHYSFSLWVFFAIAPPISGFLIPFSFLLYIKFGFKDTFPPALGKLLVKEHNMHNMHSIADQMTKPQAEHSSFGVTAREDITTKFTAASSGFESADEDPSWFEEYRTEQLERLL